MFGKKKTKSVSNVRESNTSNCGAKASDMTSGSRSTKSCGGKCTNESNSTSKASSSKACHNTRGTSNSNTKSCS